MSENQEAKRERVYKFYMDHMEKGKSFTVNHFLAEKMARSFIYDVLSRADNNMGWKRKSGSGRIAVKMPKKKVKALKKYFDQKDGIS